MNADKKTNEILEKVSEKYGLERLKAVLSDPESKLFTKDIYVSLKGIVKAAEAEGDTLEELKNAKNMYNAPVFALGFGSNAFQIKNPPDFDKAAEDMKKHSFCFALSPYHMVNTFLALVEAQVAGFELEELTAAAEEHVEASIAESLRTNPNWEPGRLTSENPVLIMPVGSAGCGKSTFYRELPDVVNLSCDNIRYLLFKEFGPCFASWESCLSWWVVNYLTDTYISRGYSVFYNGVNTDLEYRSPITMEAPDPVFAGMPYNVKIVYFKPPVTLNKEELEEFKAVDLWQNKIEDLDLSAYSDKVADMLRIVRANYLRTLSRTKEISSGAAEQDPFDVLYAVPAGVVKLFAGQSFDRPVGENVTVIERKDLPDPDERTAYYRERAAMVID